MQVGALAMNTVSNSPVDRQQAVRSAYAQQAGIDQQTKVVEQVAT